MTNHTLTLRLLAVSAIYAAVGCGGDPESMKDESIVHSGVAGDKLLSSLDRAESQRLCRATVDATFDTLSMIDEKRAACTVQASVAAVKTRPDGMLYIDRAVCEQQRDACLKALPPTVTKQVVPEGADCEISDMASDPSASCTATVGDYESCLDSALRDQLEQFEKIDCAYLSTQPVTLGGSKSTKPVMRTTPACERLTAKCMNVQI